MSKKLFAKKENCCGCGACAMACPVACITMAEDRKEGFLYPEIDATKCINCGKCEKVCPLKDGREMPENREAYALLHDDEAYRTACTSAGAFEEICRGFCGEDNFAVFGVEMDDTLKVKHSYVQCYEDMAKFRKSKYVQSDLADSFPMVKRFLEQGKRVVFSGSPCQVDGLKHYLKKDYENLLLVDFVCHGVPSAKVFQKRIEELEASFDSKVKKVIFRNKVLCSEEWNCLGMRFLFENGGELTELYPPCKYMTGFLSELYLRPSCHSCKYASMGRVSDITLGDSWGMESYDPSLSMRVNNGTSLLMMNTEKGRKALDHDAEDYRIVNVPIELLPKAQRQLVEPSKPHRCRERFFSLLPWVPFSEALETAMYKSRLYFYKKLLNCWLKRKGRKG